LNTCIFIVFSILKNEGGGGGGGQGIGVGGGDEGGDRVDGCQIPEVP